MQELSDRLGYQRPALLHIKSFEHKGTQRRSFFLIERSNGIIFIRLDRNAVTIASSAYGEKPLSQAKRYFKAEHKHIQVPRPFAINQYNSGMGVTDLMWRCHTGFANGKNGGA